MRAWLIAIALSVCVSLPAAAQSLLSPSEFRDAAMAMIRAVDPQAELEVRDDLALTIRRPHNAEQPEFQFNLDYAYRQYQADPGALTDVLDHWVRFATQPLEQSRMAERVVAVLRPASMVDDFNRASAQVRAESGLAPMPLLSRAVAGDLVQVLVFDGAETIQYANEEALSEVGLTPDAAWAIAPTNLPARLGELELLGIGGADRLVVITGGNGLAPSTLLQPDTCTGGLASFVFLLVDRNAVVAGERADELAMLQLKALLEEVRRDPQPMSTTPITCHQGRVVEHQLTD